MKESSTIMEIPTTECPICLQKITDPVSILCGHNFCGLCLERSIKGAAASICPLCRTTFLTENVQTNALLAMLINPTKERKINRFGTGKLVLSGRFEPEIELCRTRHTALLWYTISFFLFVDMLPFLWCNIRNAIPLGFYVLTRILGKFRNGVRFGLILWALRCGMLDLAGLFLVILAAITSSAFKKAETFVERHEEIRRLYEHRQ